MSFWNIAFKFVLNSTFQVVLPPNFGFKRNCQPQENLKVGTATPKLTNMDDGYSFTRRVFGIFFLNFFQKVFGIVFNYFTVQGSLSARRPAYLIFYFCSYWLWTLKDSLSVTGSPFSALFFLGRFYKIFWGLATHIGSSEWAHLEN